jgi:hypothetical protein
MLATASFHLFQEFRIEHRRTDAIDAHRPLAQVNLTTTIAAEWKVFAACQDALSARGTAEFPGAEDGFFRFGHALIPECLILSLDSNLVPGKKPRRVRQR